MPDTATGYPNPPLVPAVWPAELVPSSMQLQLVPNSTRWESVFSRTVQAAALSEGTFRLTAGFSALDVNEQGTWRAFVAKLRGCAGRFLFPAVIAEGLEPQPVALDADGFPTADVVTTGPRVQSRYNDKTLRVEGASPSLVVEPGDYVSYDTERGQRRLHIVVEYAWPVAGVLTLVVEPALSTDIPEGARVHLDCPSACFALDDDAQGALEETPEPYVDGSFSATEALAPLLPEVA